MRRPASGGTGHDRRAACEPAVPAGQRRGVRPRCHRRMDAAARRRRGPRQAPPANRRAQQVVRIQSQLHRAIEHIAFAGIALDGVEGIDLFRHLYRMGWMRLVGRVQHGSARLWKLESRPLGRSGETVRSGRLTDVRERTRLVVLVDPSSFLPVAEMQLDVSDPAHPHVVVESRLVSYRHLPADAATSLLFELPAQHPRARVISSRQVLPQFRAAHARGARGDARSTRCSCGAARARPAASLPAQRARRLAHADHARRHARRRRRSRGRPW